ncbi:MAG TPA: cation:proton antiporter [Micromonosporaceae bacterium]|nr:cation:proton antiporter [Micromonosporaceae bacterium]
MNLTRALDSLAAVAVIAALAPVVTALVRPRFPQVVFLIAGGVLIGPHMAGIARVGDLVLFSNIGLGFLFLLAGYELDPRLFGRRPGRLAVVGWVVAAVLATGVVAALTAAGLVRDYIPVGLALTTTALGTLLPILQDNDMLRSGALGPCIMAAGAVGELFPILAISLFLGARGSFVALISIVATAVLAYLLTLVPRIKRGARIHRIVQEGQHATSQTTLRWSIVLLTILLAVASEFGLDVVLGAFVAGMVLRRSTPGDVRALEGKLDAVGYGFFIPLFFVVSGMQLNIVSIAHTPGRLLIFFVLMLAVRGLPSMIIYRGVLDRGRRFEMTLLTATSLPLIVALADIGLADGVMLPANAAALVGAGALSVLVYPTFAVALNKRRRARLAEAASRPVGEPASRPA